MLLSFKIDLYFVSLLVNVMWDVWCVSPDSHLTWKFSIFCPTSRILLSNATSSLLFLYSVEGYHFAVRGYFPTSLKIMIFCFRCSFFPACQNLHYGQLKSVYVYSICLLLPSLWDVAIGFLSSLISLRRRNTSFLIDSLSLFFW